MRAMNYKALRRVPNTDTKCLNPAVTSSRTSQYAFLEQLPQGKEKGHRVSAALHGKRGRRSVKICLALSR